MEFFKIINKKVSCHKLQETFTFSNLETFTSNLIVLEQLNNSEALIGGIWGEFTLTRSLIKGGIRFALIECPNALTWTITTDLAPNPEIIVVHLTINRQTQSPTFIDEIEELLNELASRISTYF